MSKNRMVNTVFWEDNYTANLDPSEKLVFLYLLTNTSTSLSGVYQITLKKIAVETGFDREMIEKIISRFERDDKVLFRSGWIAIRNFIKHQNQNSPKIRAGIEIALQNVPDELRFFVEGKGIDTLSHSNSNTNSNTNSNLTTEPDTLSGEVNEFLNLFKEINPSYNLFFGRKPQRSASERLLRLHPLDWWARFIPAYRDAMVADKYCPKATSPMQMEEKLGAIELYGRSNRKKNESKIAFV